MIKTLAKFNISKTEEVEEFEWQPFVFNEGMISNYNRGEGDYVTVELSSGYRITIGIKYDVFEDIVKPDKTIMDAKAKYEFTEQE